MSNCIKGWTTNHDKPGSHNQQPVFCKGESMSEYDYSVTECAKVVDGDTYDLTVQKDVNFGFNFHPTLTWKARFRLVSVDTPERGEPGFTEAIFEAKRWISEMLLKGTLRGTTYKPSNPLPDGQFGRWLIDLYDLETGIHLHNHLKFTGHGV